MANQAQVSFQYPLLSLVRSYGRDPSGALRKTSGFPNLSC